MTEPIETTEQSISDIEPADGETSSPTVGEVVDLDALDAERKLSDLNEKLSGAEQLLAARDETVAELRLTIARNQVSHDTGIPARILAGTTPEAIEAHANLLREYLDERDHEREQQQRPRPPRLNGPRKSSFTGVNERPTSRSSAVTALRGITGGTTDPYSY